MSEYVQVDADRLRQLATALATAADAVRDGADQIDASATGWSAHATLTATRQAGQWCRDQVGPMRRRATLADIAAATPAITSLNDPHGGWRTVPWDATPQDLQRAGQQANRTLANALKGDPKDPVNRDLVRRMSRAAAEFKDDPTFVAGFYADNGAAAAKTARFLHDGDGTHDGRTLSDDSKRILADLGASTAAATKMSEDGRLTYPPGAVPFAALSNPVGGDLWSVAMLVKAGPKGDQWGSSFLERTGRSVLDWRKTHPNDLSYTPMTVQNPYGGYVGGKGSWYDTLGIRPNYLTQNIDEQGRNVQAIVDNDPALAILDKVGDNAKASRQLLSGADGRDIAKQLVDPHWTPPNWNDAGAPVAKVIQAATTPPKDHQDGDEARQAATAASNVFVAAGTQWNAQGSRSAYEKEQWPTIPPSIARALGATATAYTMDLAASTERVSGGPDQSAFVDQPPPGRWTVVTNVQTMRGLFHQIQLDPAAWGAFKGKVRGDIALVTAYQAAHPQDSPALLKQYGGLAGLTLATELGNGYDAAKRKDAENAQAAMYFQIAAAAFDKGTGLIDLPLAKALNVAAGVATPFITATFFPTDATAKVADQNSRAAFAGDDDFAVPVANGLLQAGKIPPPTVHGATPGWYRNGRIEPTDDTSRAEFLAWWSSQSEQGARSYEQKVQAGFQDQTTQRVAGDGQQKPR